MTFTEFKRKAKASGCAVFVNTANSFVAGITLKQGFDYIENCHLNGHNPKAWFVPDGGLWIDLAYNGEPVTP